MGKLKGENKMKNTFEKIIEMLKEENVHFEIIPMEDGKCMVVVSFIFQMRVYGFDKYGNLIETI